MSGREILTGQLDYINEQMKAVDRLGLRISEMPAPWPEMADPKRRAASAMRIAFDELVLYQRALLNHMGPRSEGLGELSSRVMEEAAKVDPEVTAEVKKKVTTSRKRKAAPA